MLLTFALIDRHCSAERAKTSQNQREIVAAMLAVGGEALLPYKHHYILGDMVDMCGAMVEILPPLAVDGATIDFICEVAGASDPVLEKSYTLSSTRVLTVCMKYNQLLSNLFV